MHAEGISLSLRHQVADGQELQVSENVLGAGLHAKLAEEDELGCRRRTDGDEQEVVPPIRDPGSENKIQERHFVQL